MKHYIAIIAGPGEGCDHTIGCNLNWKVLIAENEEQVRDKILEEYGELEGSSNPNIDEIIIYETVPDSNIVFYNLAERATNLYKMNEEEMKEREEYERLKKKYGDT